MNLIIYFTIYWILISSLAWWVDKPDINLRNDKLIFSKDAKRIIAGFTGEEAVKAFYLLVHAIIKSEKEIKNLKTAMDKESEYCEECFLSRRY